MTVLSDGDIHVGQQNGPGFGGFSVTPFLPERVQPASYDVALGNRFRYFKRSVAAAIDPLDLADNLTGLTEVEPGEPFVLHPGDFALGSTQERVHIGPTIVARIEGKSSLGRLGLVIHATAGWIDPGFEGVVTLELSNQAPLPIKLWPGMLIAQVAFMRLSSMAIRPYGSPGLGSKYQGDAEPVASRYEGDKNG